MHAVVLHTQIMNYLTSFYPFSCLDYTSLELACSFCSNLVGACMKISMVGARECMRQGRKQREVYE